MLVAFDTNILIYAAGFNDRMRAERATAMRLAFGPDQTVIATQVLGEFFNALVGKLRQERQVAVHACGLLMRSSVVKAADEAAFQQALQLASDHRLQFWDALILATAAAADCSILLSEDMQHGFVFHGVTVINPFAEPAHPLLTDALRYER
jgi:predicted nucleic acid-binding protein